MLKLLSKKEVQSFKRMVCSPYFNTQEEIIRLIDFLEPAHPKFKQIQPAEKLCSKVLQTNKGYGPKEKEKLKRLFFKTNQLLQKFLILENLNNNKTHLKQRMLMDELRSRGNIESVPAILTKSREKLNRNQTQEISYLYNDFLFSEVDFFFQIHSNNRGKSNQMQALLDSYRRYTVGQHLYYHTAAINREQILQVNYEYPLLPSILKFLERYPKDLEVPFIHAWYCAVKLLQAPKEAVHFSTLLDILNQHRSQFSESGLRQLFGFILNHCSNQVLMGDLSYLEQSFLHYKNALEEGFLFANKKLSPHHFIRIVKKALEYDKIEWVEGFIKDHTVMLHSDYKKEVIALSTSMILYSRNSISEAYEILATLGKTEDVFYELDYKILLLKIYYSSVVLAEDNSFQDAQENLIESLRIYLLPQRRKLMADPIRKGYTNFLNCFKRLRKLSTTSKKDRLQLLNQLKSDVNTVAPLFEKAWLLRELG